MSDIICLIISILSAPFVMKAIIENHPDYKRGLAEYNEWRERND